MTDFMTVAGLNRNAAPTLQSDRRSDELGQKDFLTLMAAQLQNQDPFSPMENGEFLGQMAQFSSVQGLERVNTSLAEISSQIGSQRLAAGSGMIGQHVLVPGTRARPDAAGELHGMIDVPETANAVTVLLRDGETGNLLHQIELGPQQAGQVPFAWSGLPAQIAQNRVPVRIEVQADTVQPPTPMVYARVLGVQMPPNRQDMTFSLEDYGQVSSLEVTALR